MVIHIFIDPRSLVILLLCLFHEAQAHWKVKPFSYVFTISNFILLKWLWLSENKVDKGDRPILFSMFRGLMYSENADDFEKLTQQIKNHHVFQN